MGLYNRVTGSTAPGAGNQTKREELNEPGQSRATAKRGAEPEWNFKEHEQAFNVGYRSYKVEGAPKMDVDTFFSRMREGLIELIKRELNNLNSARIQTTTWIRFTRDEGPLRSGIASQVDLAFNSLMTSVYRGSDLDQMVDGMIAHMIQIKNPALLNSRFVFDEVLYLDVNFHQLNLTRGSSHLPLPNCIAKRKAIINPHNDVEECFKWAVIAAENVGMKDPQCVSNLRKFIDNYDWSRLEFPVSLKQIGKFEANNDISINVLGLEGEDIYILRNSNYRSEWEINLLMISENGINHYTVIKSLSRLLRSSNTKHKCKQYFALIAYRGFR